MNIGLVCVVFTQISVIQKNRIIYKFFNTVVEMYVPPLFR